MKLSEIRNQAKTIVTLAKELNFVQKLDIFQASTLAPPFPTRQERKTINANELILSLALECKLYLIYLYMMKYDEALLILNKWAKLIDQLFENHVVKDSKPCLKLIKLCSYYADLFASFHKINAKDLNVKQLTIH